MRAARALVGIVAGTTAAVEPTVTIVQLRTLVVVATHSHPRLSDLASALSVHPSNASRVVDRLIRKGMLARSVSSSDRRSVTLVLTPAGSDLVDSVMVRRRSALHRAMASMPADQRAAVATAFEAFADAVGEVRDDGAWPDTGVTS